MNSRKLQLQFRSVYENFFAQHTTIFSLPLTMNRAGEWSEDYEGLNIKQKIPLRVYFGIKYNKKIS